jgi:hypothetical protein
MAFPPSQMKRLAGAPPSEGRSTFGNTVATVAASRSRATRMGCYRSRYRYSDLPPRCAGGGRTSRPPRDHRGDLGSVSGRFIGLALVMNDEAIGECDKVRGNLDPCDTIAEMIDMGSHREGDHT